MLGFVVLGVGCLLDGFLSLIVWRVLRGFGVDIL